MTEVNKEQMKLGYFAQCISIFLRMAMGNNFDFMLTIKPINKDAKRFKTVKVLCDKKVGEEN